MFVDVPGYRAILFRRTLQELQMPDALMDLSHQWLDGTEARWNGETYTWTFPSGATLSFGYLRTEEDKYRYQSAQFQFIGFDELSHFTVGQYTYLFSRLRRAKGLDIPLRMRSASNPGGHGHVWIKDRFIPEEYEAGMDGIFIKEELMDGKIVQRLFVPARLKDNPGLDQEEYIESLGELDPVTKAQLLNGDWSAVEGGTKFRRHWFKERVKEMPLDCSRYIWWIDLAGAKSARNKNPDYTCATFMGLKSGKVYIGNVVRFRATPAVVEAVLLRVVNETVTTHGHDRIEIFMEQEPGSSGVYTIDHFTRGIFLGYRFKGVKTSGSKELRADPASTASEAGLVILVEGPWIRAWLDEIEAFPGGAYDDQADSFSGGFSQLIRAKSVPYASIGPSRGLAH